MLLAAHFGTAVLPAEASVALNVHHANEGSLGTWSIGRLQAGDRVEEAPFSNISFDTPNDLGATLAAKLATPPSWRRPGDDAGSISKRCETTPTIFDGAEAKGTAVHIDELLELDAQNERCCRRWNRNAR